MDDNFCRAALDYRRLQQPGKLAVVPTKRMATQRDLALAHWPGAAAACEKIRTDPDTACDYAARGNLVGVIINGTAVLGLGNIGPLTAKPMMEGKAPCSRSSPTSTLRPTPRTRSVIDIVASLEPTFRAINLEDIKAPGCFMIELELCARAAYDPLEPLRDAKCRIKLLYRMTREHDRSDHALACVSRSFMTTSMACDRLRRRSHQRPQAAGQAARRRAPGHLGCRAAALACVDLLEAMGLAAEGLQRGPILLGVSRLVHVLTQRVTARAIANLAALLGALEPFGGQSTNTSEQAIRQLAVPRAASTIHGRKRPFPVARFLLPKQRDLE